MKKTINIYLSKDEKQKAHKIQQKYKVSLTTITDVLIVVSMYAFLHYKKRPLLKEEMLTGYWYDKGNKTSIKTPKILKEDTPYKNILEGKETVFCTNILKIYIRHEAKEFLTEEGTNYYYGEIDKKLQERQERYWDYNNFSRMSRRNLKENKEYYKRAIEQMEQK